MAAPVSRAQRLLDLIQLFRRHRRPVSGAALADELGISLRTLYRDIETLKAQGAPIEGEPGLGYVLRPGFTLPPLMFSEDEIEALVLGSRWVAGHADDPLGRAARDALAKIAAVLPERLMERLEASSLLIGPVDPIETGDVDPVIRDAIRRERKLGIQYIAADGAKTRRIVWPIALAFFDQVRIVVAWCELRDAFRHFRTDRIVEMTLDDARYPRRRDVLLKEWRLLEGIGQ